MYGKIGFDNDKYLKLQSEHIRERIAEFGGKLYLEFGGKLFDDYHASRVLPGFEPDSKLKMLSNLKDQAEIVFVISADAIEQNKTREDLGITYDKDVLRLIDNFRDMGFYVSSVVITKYTGQAAADKFRQKLEAHNINSYLHYVIEGYPGDVEKIVSDEGYGKNEYVHTTRPLVVITAPGPSSGELATCLSQLDHEHKRGITAGYAKFETFPIWNIPLKHPVNIAYEAATVDLADVNMIDPYHLDAYGVTTVNYNRDIEIFPVVNAILEGVLGASPYKSPTDMGVNMAGNCIVDDEVVRKAANYEIIRRYYSTLRDRREGRASAETLLKSEIYMKNADITPEYRKTVATVKKVMTETERPVVAAELDDGSVVTGKATPLTTASSSLLLNMLKELAGIDDSVMLISKEVIESVHNLKVNNLGYKNPRMHLDEMLIALSIIARTDENAAKAFAMLPKLRGCDVHSSVILSAVDEGVYKKLGMSTSSEPEHQTKCLFHESF